MIDKRNFTKNRRTELMCRLSIEFNGFSHWISPKLVTNTASVRVMRKKQINNQNYLEIIFFSKKKYSTIIFNLPGKNSEPRNLIS